MQPHSISKPLKDAHKYPTSHYIKTITLKIQTNLIIHMQGFINTITTILKFMGNLYYSTLTKQNIVLSHCID